MELNSSLIFRIIFSCTKFVSNEGEGKQEGVYDKAGLLLMEENDPINMGTYNYGDPNNFILHGLLDVVPYYRWGNAKGCKAEWILRDTKDFYANQEAQDAYNKIKEEMENDK